MPCFRSNDLSVNEIKKYSKIPVGVTIHVDGKPAKLSDLKERMKLTAYRFEQVEAPVVVTYEQMEQEVAQAPSTPAATSAEFFGFFWIPLNIRG